MKIVTNLTEKNINGTGIIRRPDMDFSDDGTRFRMFQYKDLFLSITKYKGTIYLDMRVDYMKTDFPYSDWSKVEECKLCEKYNGNFTEFDMEEFIKDCDIVLAKIRKMNEAFNKEEIDSEAILNQLTKEFGTLLLKMAEFKKFNWWNASKYDVDKFYDYFKSLEKIGVTIYDYINKIKGNKLEKKVLKEFLNSMNNYDYIRYADGNFYSETCEELCKKYNKEETA